MEKKGGILYLWSLVVHKQQELIFSHHVPHHVRLQMEVLPQNIPLLIFYYLPYKFILTTASFVCQAWRQIAYDKSLIKYARDEEFLETNARGSSTETLNYFLQAVQWTPSLFQSIDLSGAKATWETFRVIAHNCGELKILNMARIEGKISEYPLIQAVKIVELIITRKHLLKSGTQVSLC